MKNVQNLTEGIQKMKLGFDRVAYRRAYDKVYFKKKAVCPRCGLCRVAHKMKRHMQSKKCLSSEKQ